MGQQRFTREQTLTAEMHVWAEPWPEYVDNPNNEPWRFELRGYGPDTLWLDNDPRPRRDVYVGPVDVTFTVPGGVDLLGRAVETLKEQKATVQAKAHKRCQEFDEQIRRLQFLEHQPEEQSA